MMAARRRSVQPQAIAVERRGAQLVSFRPELPGSIRGRASAELREGGPMPYFLRLGWPVAVKKQLGLSGDSIDGNSDDLGHRGWFDIEAFSFGSLGTVPTVDTGGSRKADFNEIRFTRSVDGLSVSLKQAVAQGTSFDVAFLDVSTAGRSLAVKVENAILTGYQVGPASGGFGVTEQLTLNFTGMAVLPTASIFASLAGINADPGNTAHPLVMPRQGPPMLQPVH